MDADIDLKLLDEVPDVLPEAERNAVVAKVASPRASTEVSGPPRAELRRRRAVALVVSTAWLGGQVAILGTREDWDRLGTSYPLVQIAFPAALSALSLGVAMWPGRAGLGAGVGALRGVVLVGLVGASASALLWPMPFAYAREPGSSSFVTSALVCADLVTVMGAVPLALAALTLRRSFAAAAAERSAAAGAACGLGALAAMHLHCENILPGHVFLGHVAPAIGLAIVAAWVVARVTRA